MAFREVKSEPETASWKRLVPRTTGGVLAAIMLSVLMPLLLLQTAIYIFWFKTRTQTEMNANLEVARSVASSFESYVQDIRRQELVAGYAIEADQTYSINYAGKLLAVLKEQYPTVIRFSLVDERGTVSASSDPRVVGLSVTDQSYFQDILAGQEWTISNLTQEPFANHFAFYVARNIRTEAGRDLLIVAVIDPDTLGELVLSLKRPENGTFTLFDRDGNLAFFGGEPQVPHTSWKSVDPVLRKAMQGEESVGTIALRQDEQDHVVARVPIPGFGWTAGAGRPVSTIMQPIQRTLVWVALLNIAIVLISLAAAIGLSRFFIQRLDRLREHARLIAGGDFSSKASVTNPVELAELVRSFNTMAEQIRARQESLEYAIRDLTRSNRELEQFAYVASHDLQEPLRVITGFVQLMEKKYKGQLGAEADQYIVFITEAVSRQQELIRALLTLSRAGSQEIRLVPTDSNMAVKAASQNILQMIVDTQAKVMCDELPPVLADGPQLTQLFQNLLQNAVKFRGPESPMIRVSAQVENRTCTFAIQDNGIGIDPQHWDQIFTMFKRLHTRKSYPGTGIGLAICKKIIERHGGRIWVNSKLGEGSVFYFTLKAVGER